MNFWAKAATMFSVLCLVVGLFNSFVGVTGGPDWLLRSVAFMALARLEELSSAKKS